MKILHTADWHIGKIVNEFSMIEDQAVVLHALVEKVKELDVDVLIMAGDLYDRAIPPERGRRFSDGDFQSADPGSGHSGPGDRREP
ncbi:MAG: metallophosphoesterase [Alkalibacterium sp.]|nr:metallophosphoesterase [Alkalibacterium sp.]